MRRAQAAIPQRLTMRCSELATAVTAGCLRSHRASLRQSLSLGSLGVSSRFLEPETPNHALQRTGYGCHGWLLAQPPRQPPPVDELGVVRRFCASFHECTKVFITLNRSHRRNRWRSSPRILSAIASLLRWLHTLILTTSLHETSTHSARPPTPRPGHSPSRWRMLVSTFAALTIIRTSSSAAGPCLRA